MEQLIGLGTLAFVIAFLLYLLVGSIKLFKAANDPEAFFFPIDGEDVKEDEPVGSGITECAGRSYWI